MVGKNLCGTGPFKLDEFSLDERAVLEANDAYWLGRPNPLADVNVRKALAMAADWDAIRAALYQYNDAVPNLYYAVNPRVHGFVQRPDSTLRFVTPDRNTWVD